MGFLPKNLTIKIEEFSAAKIFSSLGKALFSLFIPGSIIALAAVLLAEGNLIDAIPVSIPIFSLMVLSIGLILGIKIKSSQLVHALLFLTLAERAIYCVLNNGLSLSSKAESLIHAVAFLIPLNLVYLSLSKERGFINKEGRRRLSQLLIQALAVYVISSYPQIGLSVYLKHSFLDWDWTNFIHMAQPALIGFILGGIFLLLRSLFTRSSIDIGFFWGLVSSFIGLGFYYTKTMTSFFLTTSGLILVISISESYFGRAYQDELTGLPARRAFNEAISKLGGKYTIAMVDIDHFKRFNDRYGHQTGDQVLRMIASHLQNISGGGRSFRYGGEEFAIIFSGMSRGETRPHLENMRKAIQNTGFMLRRGERRTKNGKKLKSSSRKANLTVSIGYAERTEQTTSPKQVVKEADDALYRAKKKGRNIISL
ncbi:MAG: GGDEF domain-containing protein [Candidatus Aminicenantes bacterium]|nr:GGDEF domain-containing protein [Candidatus Aminicenantes bacterium]